MKIYKFVLPIILFTGFFTSILAQNTSNWSINLRIRGFKFSEVQS